MSVLFSTARRARWSSPRPGSVSWTGSPDPGRRRRRHDRSGSGRPGHARPDRDRVHRIGHLGPAPRPVRALRADLPGIELDIRGEMLTPDQVAALADGSLDLGLLRPPVRSADVEVHVLRRKPLSRCSGAPPAGRARPGAAVRSEGRPVHRLPGAPVGRVQGGRDACQRAGSVPAARHEVADLHPGLLRGGRPRGRARAGVVQHLRITGATYLPLAGTPRRWNWPWPPGPGRPPRTGPGPGPG